MPIYCDESGFTGNHLLDAQQEYFAYVGVNVESDYAQDYVSWFKNKFKIQTKEIKAQRLLSRPKGREAIVTLLRDNIDSVKITCSMKRYSLACRFFEYIFEPALSEQNSIFYRLGFHKFIAHVVFHYSLGLESAEHVLQDFEHFMRSQTSPIPNTGILFDGYHDSSSHMNKIMSFAAIHKEVILDEFDGMADNLKKWILDETVTSLYPILTHWTDEIGPISVCCDESKPLADFKDTTDIFVGRTDQFYQELNGRRFPMIPHLEKPIELKPSNTEPGLQIADTFASAACYMLKNMRTCNDAKTISELLQDKIINAVFPNFDDIKDVDGRVNSIILDELLTRSSEGKCLFTGIPQVALAARQFILSKQQKKKVKPHPKKHKQS